MHACPIDSIVLGKEYMVYRIKDMVKMLENWGTF